MFRKIQYKDGNAQAIFCFTTIPSANKNFYYNKNTVFSLILYNIIELLKTIFLNNFIVPYTPVAELWREAMD